MAPPIVKRYLLAASRYWWLFPAGLALGVMGGSIAASQTDAPLPTVVEAVLVGNRSPTIFSATGVEVRDSIETLTAESLVTEALLQAVAKDVNLDPLKLSRGLKITVPSGAAASKDKKAASPASQPIKLEYRDLEEARAKRVIKLLADRIVAQSKTNNSARLREIIKSLDQRLPKVRAELTRAEQILEQYDRREGPALIAAQNGSLTGSIAQSEGQQRSMGMEVEGINAELGSLQGKLGLNADQAYVSSALSADPIIASLRTQIYQTESQLTISKKDLRAEHPTIVQLVKQMQAYEEQLAARAREVMGGNGLAAPFRTSIRTDSSLDPERQRLAMRLVELTTQRDRLIRQQQTLARMQQGLRVQLTSLPNKQLARIRLEDQLKLKKALHDQMQAKLVDARTAEAETVSSLSLAQLAEAPKEPKAPKNIPITILAGGLIGLVLGGGVIFLLDMLEGTVYTPDDLRDALRQQEVFLLGSLPQMQAASPGLVPIVPLSSSLSEAYERFRSNLRLAGDQTPRVVLITSPIIREGKTTVAYNLAVAAARSGKRTLLVEADLRSPSQAQSLGVVVDPASSIEPLHYYSQISECIQLAPEIANLYVVPSAGPQPQAAAILESNEMRRLLEDARGRFDLVILDTPPLSQCNDALFLQSFTDGMILVARPGVTQQSLLTEAIEQLNELEQSDQLRVLGAVVNGVQIGPASLPPALTREFAYQPPSAVTSSDTIAS